MKENFNANNDFLGPNFDASIAMLHNFEIQTFEEFQKIMLRHKQRLIEHDKGFLLDKKDAYIALEGPEFVQERIQKGFFFSYQALINVALKMEFPEEFDNKAFRRNS